MIVTNEKELRIKNLDVDISQYKIIIRNLEKELKESDIPGIGLAAPQIGIHKRVAIVRTVNEKIDIVNPIIIEKKHIFINKDEGCLSFPGKRFNTYRYKEIFVKDDLHPEGFVATDLEAIVILHEIEHLEGILIVDRAIGNKIGRNDKCPCGSGLKYKKCHGR